MVAEVCYREIVVAPEWGAARIREDGSQKGPPVGTFQCCNPKAETKTRKNLASAQVLEAEWPEVRAARGWARQIGPHPVKHWGCVSFC